MISLLLKYLTDVAEVYCLGVK